MSQETTTFVEIADGLASYVGESAGDIQRHIVTPALMDVIGPVMGKEILDLYCGAGSLTRRLAALGANVTAVDNSERLIGIAKEVNSRENLHINYAVAEPTDLSVIGDSVFDDIVCNMGLMMTRDLAGAIAELARMVKLGGRFIFSVVHPCFCMPDACWVRDDVGRVIYRAVDNYHTEGWWPFEVSDVVRNRTKIKHRTIAGYVNALSSRGFNVRRIIEPRPSPDTLVLKPHLDIYDRLPAVMIIEAIFPYL